METVRIFVKNMTGGTADITVSHLSAGKQVADIKVWQAVSAGADGEEVFETSYEPTLAHPADYWYVSAAVRNGDAPGTYESTGTKLKPGANWALGLIRHDDITVFVYRDHFHLRYAPLEMRQTMLKTGPYAEKIRHVFVLMMENRSFDHLFGWSRWIGTNVADGTKTQIEGARDVFNNLFEGQRVFCAPVDGTMTLSADPGHEFDDVMEGLCGAGRTLNPDGSYPDPDVSGFVTNYGKALAKWKVDDFRSHLREIMSGVPDQSLVLHQFARDYAICDKWFASMPGPTWPNRIFAMAATSGGLELSPGPIDTILAVTAASYKFDNGNLFSKLRQLGFAYRIYKDTDNPFAVTPAGGLALGRATIATALDGISQSEVQDYKNLASDLDRRYPYQFTFIEPHYGNAANSTYTGGSSQHPLDGLEAGDALIAATFNTIRNSAHWDDSLLIITYDEAGGLYDHCVPPNTDPPGDTPRYRTRGFDFRRLGPRVPAVVVSPHVLAGSIDHAVYDHTSIAATVLELFAPGSQLTVRDGKARNLIGLLQRDPSTPDTRPTSYPVPKEQRAVGAPNQHVRDSDPLPAQGNEVGFVLLSAKAEFELSDRSPEAEQAVNARLARVKTYGDARDYAAEVLARVDQVAEDADKIDDLIYGESGGARGRARDAATLEAVAADLGLDLPDLQALVTASFAGNLKRRITQAALDAPRSKALLDTIQAYESSGTEIFDIDDTVYRIPSGTSKLLGLPSS